MSVALFSATSLGSFAATIAHLELDTLESAISLAESVAFGNAAAWNAQYNESEEVVSRDAIAEVARRLVGDEDALIAAIWPLAAYNMVTNEGTVYIAAGVNVDPGHPEFVKIQAFEKACSKWQDAKLRSLKHAEQNAVAFNEVGQQKTATRQSIADECRSLGYARVIVAEFSVNESDSMTDYYGGRHTRSIVIGYGKGKRESFKQLRDAAGAFKPTENYGTGKNRFTASVVFAENHESKQGGWSHKGSKSHWHSEMESGTVFTTREAAEAFIAYAGEPCDVNDGGSVATFKWGIREESIENRENYSMGGGNYLGENRYGGWKVSSISVDWFKGDELAEISDFTRKPVKALGSQKTKKVSEAVVVRHDVDGDFHDMSVSVGKSTLSIGFGGNYVCVNSGRSRLGKTFSNWERAAASYKAANIKKAIFAARDAVLARLDGEGDRAPAEQPKPASVDPATFDEFAWM